jgi:hypothetical protein
MLVVLELVAVKVTGGPPQVKTPLIGFTVTPGTAVFWPIEMN